MNNKLERPYTTVDFYDKLISQLNEEQKMPDILDYALVDKYKVQELRKDDFRLFYVLQYGDSEGIYMDLYIDGDWGQHDQNTRIFNIGTCKTLHESDEAMVKMAELGAWFTIKADKFIREHSEELVWYGYTAEFSNDDRKYHLLCQDLKSVFEKLAGYGGEEKFAEIMIRDNATRQIWTKDELEQLRKE